MLQHLLVAEDVMRPVGHSVRPDDTLARALRRLGHHGLGELPVIDGKGHLVAAISRREVLAVYDWEVLRREAELVTFVESETAATSSSGVVEVPAGDTVARIPVTPKLAGQTLRDLNLRARFDVHVIGLRHREPRADEDQVRVPDSGESLIEGDVLVVSGPQQRIREVRKLAGLDR